MFSMKSRMSRERSVTNLLKRLAVLDCPYFMKGKVDSWNTSILFKPCFERYSLMLWILNKLKIMDSEVSKQHFEGKMLNLLVTLSALGVCSEKDTDIIQARAPFPKQLAFWKTLISLLWSKKKKKYCSSKYVYFCKSENDSKEYEHSCDYIYRACESVNFKHAFDIELQLLPPYLKKEIKPILEEKNKPLLCTEDVKKLHCEKYDAQESNIISDCGIGELSLPFNKITNCEIPDENCLAETENNFSAHGNDFKKAADDLFRKYHDELRLYLTNALPEFAINPGMSFKAADKLLQSVSRCKHSAALLASTDSDLEDFSSEISNFQIPPGQLSDIKLTDYMKTLSEAKKE